MERGKEQLGHRCQSSWRLSAPLPRTVICRLSLSREKERDRESEREREGEYSLTFRGVTTKLCHKMFLRWLLMSRAHTHTRAHTRRHTHERTSAHIQLATKCRIKITKYKYNMQGLQSAVASATYEPIRTRPAEHPLRHSHPPVSLAPPLPLSAAQAHVKNRQLLCL